MDNDPPCSDWLPLLPDPFLTAAPFTFDFLVMLASLIATWFVLVHLAVFGHGAAVPAVISDPLPAYIARHLGPYSPWYAAGEYLAPPSSCELEQANILQRHGARFPTANAGKKYAASVAKLRENATSLSAALQFVRSYTCVSPPLRGPPGAY